MQCINAEFFALSLIRCVARSLQYKRTPQSLSSHKRTPRSCSLITQENPSVLLTHHTREPLARSCSLITQENPSVLLTHHTREPLSPAHSSHKRSPRSCSLTTQENPSVLLTHHTREPLGPAHSSHNRTPWSCSLVTQSCNVTVCRYMNAHACSYRQGYKYSGTCSMSTWLIHTPG